MGASPIPFFKKTDMKTKFISDTVLSIDIRFEKGEHKYISFQAQSNGGSYYITEDEEEVKALEKHYRYGTMFRKDETFTDKPKEEKEPMTKASNEPTPIKVTDIAEARDYIADTFGISRTALRTNKAVEEQAEKHNIKFVYPNE